MSTSDYGQSNWIWGKDGPGAILMANSDYDPDETIPESGTESELSELRLEPVPSEFLENDVTLHAFASDSAALRFTMYRKTDEGTLIRILGCDTKGDGTPVALSEALSFDGEQLYIEANQLPGEDFEGLITLESFFLQGRYLWRSQDAKRLVFRVAPWIMTHNTQRTLRVFTVKTGDGISNNDAFVNGLESACNEAGVPLTIIDSSEYQSDRWIQDEIEFGYCQTPSHSMPVVFDSPQDRGLDTFPEKELLGPDFGHFSVGNIVQNSLDSIGNLEVSPPVEVNGKKYPFGRIVFGGKKIGSFADDDRQMMPGIKRMLYAQKVQSTVELYSDWLAVGHIDEFLNFIPDTGSSKGFRLLLASPALCLRKLHELETRRASAKR